MVLLSKLDMIEKSHVAEALIMKSSEEHYHQYRDKRGFIRSPKRSALPFSGVNLSLDVFGALLLDSATK